MGTRYYVVGTRFMSWERDNYVVGMRSYVVGTRSYVVGTRSYLVGTR